MPLPPRPSSKGTSLVVADRGDPTLPAILEFQSPSTAISNAQVPRFARGVSWILFSSVIASFLLSGLIKIDKVVTTPGRVISKSPTLSVQTLDTAIIRSIEVKEGDPVHAGQVLARLDPTFAAADLSALTAQVSALQAQTARLQAELDNRPFGYTGLDPNLSLQAAIYAQRQAEYHYKLENYKQKADSMSASIARAKSDIAAYRSRLTYARTLEDMRKELEHLNVGSKINTLSAMDTRVEMQRNLDSAEQQAQGMQRDLAAQIAERDAYVQAWHAEVADKLSDATSKLSDAREQLNKAQLHRQLVELRADRDATVLAISKLAVGSVLTASQQVMTLVPADAPLEVEVNIPGAESGYVHVGDPVSVKFETLPYAQYGGAHGTVRVISPDSFTAQDEQRNPSGALPGGDRGIWYRARVSLDRIELHDTPAGFQIMPGMPTVADILVGKRTILNYFLGRTIPLFREGMREP
jgi:hemolysin D